MSVTFLLSEIFGVSTDYLVKDEIDEVESIKEDIEPGVTKITLEKANAYINDKMMSAKLTSIGVLVVILSIAPLIILLAFANIYLSL